MVTISTICVCVWRIWMEAEQSIFMFLFKRGIPILTGITSRTVYAYVTFSIIAEYRRRICNRRPTTNNSGGGVLHILFVAECLQQCWSCCVVWTSPGFCNYLHSKLCLRKPGDVRFGWFGGKQWCWLSKFNYIAPQTPHYAVRTIQQDLMLEFAVLSTLVVWFLSIFQHFWYIYITIRTKRNGAGYK